jgi:hypothetical protein
MVFDIRGRRKHVVRVVYAILALLMGASLFLVVGPFSIGNLIGNSGTANTKFEQERAERLEKKLVREPESEALLVALTRARIAAGNLEIATNPETGASELSAEGQANYARGLETWQRYLKQAESPNPAVAHIVAETYFRLAQGSPNLEGAEENLEGAADAQRIAAAGQPNLNTLSTLAMFEYFNGNFAAGDKAAKRATATAPKEEAKEVKKKLGEFRLRGKQLENQKKEFAKLEKKQGKEALQNPFGGLGTGTGTPGQ